MPPAPIRESIRYWPNSRMGVAFRRAADPGLPGIDFPLDWAIVVVTRLRGTPKFRTERRSGELQLPVHLADRARAQRSRGRPVRDGAVEVVAAAVTRTDDQAAG